MNTLQEMKSGLEGEFMDLEASSKFEAGKEHAVQAAREMKEAAMLKATEVRNTAMNRVSDARRRVEGQFREVTSQCEQRTREAPVNSLLIALGAGFLLGFILRR